ncbi:MAG: thiamine diphosphokinase [Bacteroidales bacterium]|nr:thiamine diphosphokinase [Bacteroidales bacterium]
MAKPVVILADSSFPTTGLPLGYLENSDQIVCCDGSVSKLVEYGLEPWAIAGDLDSVSEDLKKKYADRLYYDGDQETNDLTKAVRYCLVKGITDIVILGATGLREDHTLANISLLADYAESLSVKMVTDHGIIIPVQSGKPVSSWQGQQISLFAIDNDTKISSEGLKYPLDKLELKNWWMGTLNECTGDSFTLNFDSGRVLAFLEMQ